MSQPQPGDLAPEFTAPSISAISGIESLFSFGAQTELPTVLYFYPKDNTPGCTTQACGLRDSWAEVRSRANVFGVSPDTIMSHLKFIQKFDLPFSLISDVDTRIAQAYGVWVEKNLYGRKYMGVERTTFVIGTDRVIKSVLAKVKPDKHVDLVLGALDQ